MQHLCNRTTISVNTVFGPHRRCSRSLSRSPTLTCTHLICTIKIFFCSNSRIHGQNHLKINNCRGYINKTEAKTNNKKYIFMLYAPNTVKEVQYSRLQFSTRQFTELFTIHRVHSRQHSTYSESIYSKTEEYTAVQRVHRGYIEYSREYTEYPEYTE